MVFYLSLEDWMRLVKVYSRFAWNAKIKGGQAAVNQFSATLEQMLNPDPNVEGQAPGVFVGNHSTTMQPYKFPGATINIDDSRRYMLMVSSSTGTPEHLLTADPSTSNLATSKTLERPSELQYKDRRRLWADIFQNICQNVISQYALATKGSSMEQKNKTNMGRLLSFLKGRMKTEILQNFPERLQFHSWISWNLISLNRSRQ